MIINNRQVTGQPRGRRRRIRHNADHQGPGRTCDERGQIVYAVGECPKYGRHQADAEACPKRNDDRES